MKKANETTNEKVAKTAELIALAAKNAHRFCRAASIAAERDDAAAVHFNARRARRCYGDARCYLHELRNLTARDFGAYDILETARQNVNVAATCSVSATNISDDFDRVTNDFRL